MECHWGLPFFRKVAAWPHICIHATTWLSMLRSHVYIHATSSSLFTMPCHSGATLNLVFKFRHICCLAGTMKERLGCSTMESMIIARIFNLKFDTASLFVFILRYFHLVLASQSHSQVRPWRSRLNLELSFKLISYHSRVCNLCSSDIGNSISNVWGAQSKPHCKRKNHYPDRCKLLIFFLFISFF